MIEMFSALGLKALLDSLAVLKNNIPKMRSRNDKLFLDIVDPIFVRLQPLIDDYFRFFGSAIEKLNVCKNDDDVSLVVSQLENVRVTQLSNRMQIIELAKSLAEEVKDHAVGAFLQDVASIFATAEKHRPVWSPSMAHDFVEYWKALPLYNNAHMNKTRMIELAKANLGIMEHRWINLVRTHARLRIRTLMKRAL